MGKSFEDFIKIASNDTVATANVDESTLSKLAAMIDEQAAVPAAASVVAATPEVVGATEAVLAPQVMIAGGNLEEAAAGEMPGAIKPNEGVVISASDGVATIANQFGKDPASVMAAATPAEAPAAPIEKTASIIEAEEMGAAMAHSYVGELQKVAADAELVEATEILKEAGLLEDYDI